MIITLIGAGVASLFLLSGLRVINQYEKGVKFTLGKYSGNVDAGLTWICPIIQQIHKVDTRQTIIDLKPQEVMTKDQVNLKIDGIVFYYIKDADKVILNVEDIREQLGAKATSELKEVVGNMTMSEALSNREKIAKELKKNLDEAISDAGHQEKKDWGVVVKMIQINNIELPKELIRAMSKEAEAEREKKAILIRAQGEEEASKKYEEASKRYSSQNALRLRELKTYEEIGKENNTMMIVIPSQMATGGNGNWVLPFAKNLRNKNKDNGVKNEKN